MSTSDHLAPRGATVEQLRDYFEGHVQNGRGRFPVALDPRGLSWLFAKIETPPAPDVRLALPLNGEGSHDGARVFVRAVF